MAKADIDAAPLEFTMGAARPQSGRNKDGRSVNMLLHDFSPCMFMLIHALTLTAPATIFYYSNPWLCDACCPVISPFAHAAHRERMLTNVGEVAQITMRDVFLKSEEGA